MTEKNDIRPISIESVSEKENDNFMKMWFELKRELNEFDDYKSIQLSIVFSKMREIEIMALTNPVYKIDIDKDE